MIVDDEISDVEETSSELVDVLEVLRLKLTVCGAVRSGSGWRVDATRSAQATATMPPTTTCVQSVSGVASAK